MSEFMGLIKGAYEAKVAYVLFIFMILCLKKNELKIHLNY